MGACFIHGREINDGMGKYIVENTISNLDQQGVPIDGAKDQHSRFNFKENCPDLRNTSQGHLNLSILKQYNCKLIITDEWADNKEVMDQNLGVDQNRQ